MAEMLWVVNSSPLITLAKIGQMNLLPQLCRTLVIPRAVAEEIEAGPADDPARRWLRLTGQAWVKPIDHLSSIIAAWDLGAGETEVLSWAEQHGGYQAIIDDLAARRCASLFGISHCGTIGVIVRAKKHGCIPLVAPLLRQLRESGLRIDDTLFETALELAGEGKAEMG